MENRYLGADRWWVTVTTPDGLSVDSKDDMPKEIAILCPGWYKGNEMLKHAANGLAEREVMPIILDTRTAYFDRFDAGTKQIPIAPCNGACSHYHTAWHGEGLVYRPLKGSPYCSSGSDKS